MEINHLVNALVFNKVHVLNKSKFFFNMCHVYMQAMFVLRKFICQPQTQSKSLINFNNNGKIH